MLITFPSATGSIVLVNYATKIFVEADSSISPILSSIIVSLIQLIGAYIATFLVEKVGRKVRIVNLNLRKRSAYTKCLLKIG